MQLNIGGSRNKSAWRSRYAFWKVVDIHKDADFLVDLNKGKLPFADNSVDAIYTSHTLEHILPHMIVDIFSEMYRVLKTKAKIRIVVPNIDAAIKAYLAKDTRFLSSQDAPTKLECLPNLDICHLNSWFFSYYYKDNVPNLGLGGHVIGFNDELLRHYLVNANFINLENRSPDNCSEVFKEMDIRRYKSYSLYVEAQK